MRYQRGSGWQKCRDQRQHGVVVCVQRWRICVYVFDSQEEWTTHGHSEETEKERNRTREREKQSQSKGKSKKHRVKQSTEIVKTRTVVDCVVVARRAKMSDSFFVYLAKLSA